MGKKRAPKAAPAKPASPATPAVPLAAWVLVGAALLAPVAAFAANSPAQSVDVIAVVVGVAALAAAYLFGRAGFHALPSSRLDLVWAAFLLWSLLSVLVSGRVWGGLMGEPGNLLGWALLGSASALILATLAYADDVRSLLVRFAPWLVIVQSLAVVAQAALGQSPRGTLPNSTYLGELLVLLLPFVVIPVAGKRSAVDSWPRRAAALAAIVALGASGSRVAAVVAVVWAVWVVGRTSGLAPRVRTLATLGVISAVVVAGLVFARAEILGTATAGTFGDRPAMLRIAAAATAMRPLTGWGLDGFRAGGTAATTLQFARTGPVTVFREGFTDPHNIVALIVVSTGLVGLALAAWVLLELVLRWVARWRAGKADAAAIWAVAGFGVILLTAPATMHVIPAFCVAVALSLGRVDFPSQRDVRWRAGIVLLVALGIAAAFLFKGAAFRMPFERYDAQRSPGLARTCQQVADLWRYDPHLYYLASLHWGYAAQTDGTVAAKRPDLAALERAVELDPRNAFHRLEYARTLRFYQQPAEKVEAAFEAVFPRYPFFPVAHAEYAEFLAGVGKEREAREHLAVAEMVSDSDVERTEAIEATRQLLGE